MATKTKKTAKKGTTLNRSLVNASIAAINTTVENGEKWQKLTKELIKKSEPVRKKQVNMVFETATAVKNQVNSGKDRVFDLVGLDPNVIEKAVNRAKKNPVGKKVIEVKGDVLEQVQKILNKGEEIVEDAKAPKKTTKQIKSKGATKVKKVRKTTNVKATTAKKKTAARVATVKAAANTAVKEIKTEGAKKVASVKETGKEKVAVVKKETKKEIKTAAKDDLKIIYGIGPKLETVFNKNGINTYADLAKTDKSKIETILEEAGPVFKNTDTSDWKKQAEVGAEEGVEALEKWVARYRTA